MRRAAVLLLSVTSLTLLGPFPARGQPSPTPSSTSAAVPGVVLTLLGESAWNGPGRQLTFTVRATNGGTASVGHLSVVLTIGSPTRSRSLYEESLTSDPTPAVFTLAYPQRGALASGASRTFHVAQPLDIPTIGGESALYPLRIDLRSADQVLATIRSPMVFLAEPPQVPLNVSWTFVLSDPLQFGPDNVLGPGPVEADIAPGGLLDREIRALDGKHAVAADLAVSPVLVGELRRMASGYRRRAADGTVTTVAAGTAGAQDAVRLLAALTRVAARPSVEVIALPFGDAPIPATVHAGFRNLSTLLSRGRTDVQTALGAAPARELFRPPGSQLDAASLPQLVGRGITTLLVDAGFVPTPTGLPFSPPSLARLTGGGRAATAVLPDQGAMTIATAYADDPVLAAHAVLGEMAARYFELPHAAGRGAALLFPERPTEPLGIFASLSTLLSSSPWLSPVNVTGFLTRVPLQEGGEPVPTSAVPNRSYPSFDATFLSSLSAARSSLSVFRDTVVGADAFKDGLNQDLLAAQSGTFVREPETGSAYIGAVTGAISRTYRAVQANGSTITLTSQHGVVPLTVRNDSPYALRVQVVLSADARLSIGDGGRKVVTLAARQSLPLQFSVSAKSTGRLYALVRILTLGGQVILPPPGAEPPQIIVRSTAYNRVALAITIGAALFLALWWGRRFLPRRTS